MFLIINAIKTEKLNYLNLSDATFKYSDHYLCKIYTVSGSCLW